MSPSCKRCWGRVWNASLPCLLVYAVEWLFSAECRGIAGTFVWKGVENIPHTFSHSSSSKPPVPGGGVPTTSALSHWICENLIGHPSWSWGFQTPGHPSQLHLWVNELLRDLVSRLSSRSIVTARVVRMYRFCLVCVCVCVCPSGPGCLPGAF